MSGHPEELGLDCDGEPLAAPDPTKVRLYWSVEGAAYVASCGSITGTGTTPGEALAELRVAQS